MVSPQRRNEIINALRRGTVPQSSLDTFAVGLDPFEAALDEELASVSAGTGAFKAVRGDYGSGKTFFARWLQERARQHGFVTAEVQISETETPLHRLETVYRRLIERLSTSSTQQGALRSILDAWFYALEEDVLAEGSIEESDTEILLERTTALMEQRLSAVNRHAPAFSAALRAYRVASGKGETAIADGILAWLGGEPNVGMAAKRYAGLKGDVDHFGALSFVQGLLVILQDSGFSGLLLVLDEVETLQRVRSDVREKSLNALRQLIDEIDAGRFPGLYLLITGTPAFFDGHQGIRRLPPLAQRLEVDFDTDPKFDNPRAPQIRLQPFDQAKLEEVGRRIRDLYAEHSRSPRRILQAADDAYVRDLVQAVTGQLGGKVGIAPRIFLKKLVGDVLDRIDQHDDFDPRRNYSLTVKEGELTEVERNARPGTSADDIELEL